MNALPDTIAAIATAPGEAGISIVRISGSLSLNIADQVLNRCNPLPSERSGASLIHGFINSSGTVVDEVIALIMKAPHSYTREDVVELQCHGGSISAKRVLRAVLDSGARIAEPGEFTKRAFLNNRIDLLQAEAVLDIIRAHSDRAAAAALDQLDGRLSDSIGDVYNVLIAINSDLEATLDFPDDELPQVAIHNLILQLQSCLSNIQTLLSNWSEGRILREGALVVISGKPNVGKSTLLNLLLGSQRAIVAPTPGTTRDTIEETSVIDNYPIRLVDTAGLRLSDSAVEKEGVERALHYFNRADLNLYMVDCSIKLDDSDLHYISKLDPLKTILILNKIDLGEYPYPVRHQAVTTLRTSLIDNSAIDEIKKCISSKLSLTPSSPPHAVISERHYSLLISATGEITKTLEMLQTSREDLLVLSSCRLRAAAEFIGQITGRNYSEDLLNTIFSRFCVGK